MKYILAFVLAESMFFLSWYYEAHAISRESNYYSAIIADEREEDQGKTNYQKICEYYGLKCRKIKLRDLYDDIQVSKDIENRKLKAIAVSSESLNSDYMNTSKIKRLEKIIRDHSLNVLIYNTKRSKYAISNIDILTNGIFVDFETLPKTPVKYVISLSAPEVTKHFTGFEFNCLNEKVLYSVRLDKNLIANMTNVNNLISVMGAGSEKAPVFIRIKYNKGNIFIISNIQRFNLEKQNLMSVYKGDYISQIIPVMMFIRYSYETECWHNEWNFANFMIDDPNLIEPYGALSYKALLSDMKRLGYHTTVGFIPWNYDRCGPEAIKLFRKNREFFSVIIHGNNHSLGEFETPDYAKNEKNIKQAVNRMEEFNSITGISYERIMLFPREKVRVNVLSLLKKYNFLFMVSSSLPLGSQKPADIYYGSYPAIMNFENFPLVLRHSIRYNKFPFDLFIGKPLIIYTHIDCFLNGKNCMNKMVQKVNAIIPRVTWKSLDEIGKHLYLQKENYDGSIDIRFYTNEITIYNKSKKEKAFHLRKDEFGPIGISKVTAFGVEVPFNLAGNCLKTDILLAPDSRGDVKIIYNRETGDKVDIGKDNLIIDLQRYLSEYRDKILSSFWLGGKLLKIYYRKGYKFFLVPILFMIVLPLSIFFVWKVKIREKEK